ncbi:MAG: hypothetical protein ACYTFX_10670 [Planctomycetota bacterium]|jgi:hypothetical protein
MGIFLKYVLPVLGLIIYLGIPFVYVLLTGRFGKGIGLTWFLMVAWYVVLSIPISNVLLHSHKELVLETLPEGNSIVAAFFTGWLPGIVISMLALFLRILIMKFGPSLLNKTVKIEHDEKQ